MSGAPLEINGVDLTGNAILTAGEASAVLGVHVKTIHRWVKEGRIKGFLTPGGHARVPASTIREILGLSSEEPVTSTDLEDMVGGTEIAAVFGVYPTTPARWAKEGRVRSHMIGGQYRFRISEVMEDLMKHPPKTHPKKDN